MATKKYPVGTKIRYIIGTKDSWHDFYGKTGIIVDIIDKCPLIYLPDSVYKDGSCFSTVDRPATIQCGWDDIELLVMKNEQLMFGFMSDA